MTSPAEFKEADFGNGSIEIGRYTDGYEQLNLAPWADGASLTIGSFSQIGRGFKIQSIGAARSNLMTNFPLGQKYQKDLGAFAVTNQATTAEDVSIGNDVSIGEDVTILSGVSIADGAIVVAGSTVAQDVGPYEIWGGIPAQKLRGRFEDKIIEQLLHLKWWSLPTELLREMAPLLSTQPSEDLLSALQSIVDAHVTFDEASAA